MPREHRVAMGGERKLSPKATNFIGKINSDIRALNSSILILSQKMKYMVRNEKILGRNLVVLNKKIRGGDMAGGSFSGEGSEGASQIQNELARINEKLEEHSNLLAELRSDVDTIRETFAKEEEVKEIKYVIDAINPMEFVTRKDIGEIMGKKAEQKAKKN